MKHLMVDIETLGVGENAVVLSAAAVWFDPHFVEQTGGITMGEPWVKTAFEYHFNRTEQTDRNTNADTCKWWLGLPNDAILRMINGQERATQDSTFNKIEWMMDAFNEADNIWANGPDFDCIILKSFTQAEKWPFRKHRCVRTLKNLFPDAAKEADQYALESMLVPHDPLHDCMWQARIVTNVYKQCREKGIVLP